MVKCYLCGAEINEGAVLCSDCEIARTAQRVAEARSSGLFSTARYQPRLPAQADLEAYLTKRVRERLRLEWRGF